MKNTMRNRLEPAKSYAIVPTSPTWVGRERVVAGYESRRRGFVTYLSLGPDSQIRALKGDQSRTIGNYGASIVDASRILPEMHIITDAITFDNLKNACDTEALNIEVMDSGFQESLKARFTKEVLSGARSMLSDKCISQMAEVDYIAATHCKLAAMQWMSDKSKNAYRDITWIDAGIFMSTHRYKHGSRSYDLSSSPSCGITFASSFDPLDLVRQGGFEMRVLTSESKTQLCGPSFTLDVSLIDDANGLSQEFIDRSIRKYRYIPTEQCTYLLSFLQLGFAPTYIVRHYREIYRKILARPRPSGLDSFLGKILLRKSGT